MNTMRYGKGVLSAVCCGLLFTACSLFEPDPGNIYDESRIKEDPSFAEGVLLNAYRELPSVYPYDEVATDDAATNDKGNSYRLMAAGSWSEHTSPVSRWGCYTGISYLNRFLGIVDGVPWSKASARRNELFRTRYKGEALALRAFYYYHLLKAHGGYASSGDEALGVPYFKVEPKATNESEWKIARTSYKECVQYMLQDLNEAIALLPYDYKDKMIEGTNDADDDYNRVCGTNHRNRMSGRIARALKARIALHAASPAFNNGSYDLALCDTAITEAGMLISQIGGVAALSGALKDAVYYDADDDVSNEEVLWRQDYTTTYDPEKENFPPSMNGRGRINPSPDFVNCFGLKSGEPLPMDGNGNPKNDATLGFDITDPYVNRDPRLANCVICNGSMAFGSTPVRIYGTNNDAVNKTENSTTTGYYLRKNLRLDASVQTNSEMGKRHISPIVRYTEIFLIYAEALDQKMGPDGKPGKYANEPSAREVIHALRTRGGITGTDYVDGLNGSAFTALLRNERRIELCFEGFRFWDIRRWGEEMNTKLRTLRIQQSGSKFTYTLRQMDDQPRNYQNYMQYGPIPYSERTKNPKLQQNENW